MRCWCRGWQSTWWYAVYDARWRTQPAITISNSLFCIFIFVCLDKCAYSASNDERTLCLMTAFLFFSLLRFFLFTSCFVFYRDEGVRILIMANAQNYVNDRVFRWWCLRRLSHEARAIKKRNTVIFGVGMNVAVASNWQISIVSDERHQPSTWHMGQRNENSFNVHTRNTYYLSGDSVIIAYLRWHLTPAFSGSERKQFRNFWFFILVLLISICCWFIGLKYKILNIYIYSNNNDTFMYDNNNNNNNHRFYFISSLFFCFIPFIPLSFNFQFPINLRTIWIHLFYVVHPTSVQYVIEFR